MIRKTKVLAPAIRKQTFLNIKLSYIILFIIFILLLIQAWYIFYISSWFALTNIEISGQKLLSEQNVLDLSEIRLGQRIFDLDFLSIENKVLAKEPILQAVRILQISPNTLQIRVSERPVILRLNALEVGLAVVNDGSFKIIPLESIDAKEEKIIIDLKNSEKESHKISLNFINLIRKWLELIEKSSLKDYSYLNFIKRDELVLSYQNTDILIDEVDSFVKHEAKIIPLIEKMKQKEKELRYIDVRFDSMVVRFK